MNKVWVFNEAQLDRALAEWVARRTADTAKQQLGAMMDVDVVHEFLRSDVAQQHGLVMECNPKPPAPTPPFAPSPRAGEGRGEGS